MILNKSILNDIIHYLSLKITYVRYSDGSILNMDSLNRIKKQIKTLEDAKMIESTIAFNENYPKCDIIDYYNTLTYLEKQLDKYLERYIFSKIDHIAEFHHYNNFDNFETDTNLDNFKIIRMKNGYIHCDYDCAIETLSEKCRTYYLFNELLSYEQWNKNVEVRRNKILKIKSKIL
jgi:hypothetical protein